MEIQRLIGRSLRSVTDMTKLGERTLTVDCDVLQADGGTRMASITGAYVALLDSMDKLGLTGRASPMLSAVAGLSAGIRGGDVLLDMCYEEDSSASVDFNVVMTDSGQIIEVQGTGEGPPLLPGRDGLHPGLRLPRPQAAIRSSERSGGKSGQGPAGAIL